jgi:trimeric autotransporter adhesin
MSTIIGFRAYTYFLLTALSALVAGCGNSGSSTGTSTTPPPAATLQSVQVSAQNAQAALGTSAQLTATALFSDGTHQDVTSAATWSSSNAAVVATVSATPGMVTSVSTGTATISAAYQGMSASLQFAATPATLISLQVTPSMPSIANGLSTQMTAMGTFSDHTTQNLTDQVTWSIANSAVATISNATGSNGLLNTATLGSTAVTATSGSVTGSTTITVTAATLASIQVTPANSLIAPGNTQVLTATGVFSDGSKLNISSQVTWSSSNTAAATVSASNNSGELATGVAAGIATVTATLGSVSGSAMVSVTSATLVSIQVAPGTSSVAAGTTQQFVATGTYSDNTTQNLTSTVTWSSGTSSVATISNATGLNGLASALTTGSSTISASLGGVTSTGVTLTVTAAALVSIQVTPATLNLALGTQQQLSAIGVYSDQSTQDLTASVAWSTSKPSVGAAINGTASAGLVESFGIGTATITATARGTTISGSSTLTVSAAKLVSLAVTPAAVTLSAGTAQQFVATGTYSDNTTQNLTSTVTWSSDTPGVATVSNAAGSNGLASTLIAGSSTISASLGSVTSTGVTLTVTAAMLVSIQVNPGTLNLALGTQQQLSATGVYSDQSTQDLTASVTWSTSNPSVGAAINGTASAGLVESLGIGTATITATAPGTTISGSSTLTVSAAALESIAVTPTAVALPAGITQQFVATGTYSDNTTQNVTSTVTWSSDTSSVATISNATGSNGLASTLTAGSSTISASLGSVTSNGVPLTVTAATLVSIQVTPATLNLALGTQQQLSATGVYSDQSTQDLTASVTWSTSQPSVGSATNGTVSAGLVESLGIGTATITATAPGTTISGSSILTVSAAKLVSLAVTAVAVTLPVGITQQYVAMGTFSDNSTQNLSSSVTWTSDTPTVATISNAAAGNGIASAVSVGHANISATLGSVTSPTVTLTVTTATLVSIQVTAPSPSLPLGNTETLKATGTFSDESTQDLSTQVKWTSSNALEVPVSSTGVVSTFAIGSTQITASLNRIVSAPVTLDVTMETLANILVTTANRNMLVGQTRPFTAIGIFTDNSTLDLTSVVTWNSTTPGVAAVSNTAGSKGSTSALTVGTATITASAGGITSNGVTLTVTDHTTLNNTGLGRPFGIATDSSGNIYTTDVANNRICELNAQGGCTVIGAAAGLQAPTGIAIDSNDNIYVADENNGRVCKINAQGGCTVVGVSAGFQSPTGVAVDSAGNVYVADISSSRVCLINAQDGCTQIGAAAGFVLPYGIAVDARNIVYVTDFETGQVCEITTIGGCANLASTANLDNPTGVAIDGNGIVYVADFANGRVCELTAQGGCKSLGASTGFPSVGGVAVGINGQIYATNPNAGQVVQVAGP